MRKQWYYSGTSPAGLSYWLPTRGRKAPAHPAAVYRSAQPSAGKLLRRDCAGAGGEPTRSVLHMSINGSLQAWGTAAEGRRINRSVGIYRQPPPFVLQVCSNSASASGARDLKKCAADSAEALRPLSTACPNPLIATWRTPRLVPLLRVRSANSYPSRPGNRILRVARSPR